MVFACFHLLSTYVRNSDGSNPESRKQGKRAVESAVLSGVNPKFISFCAETGHATFRHDFKLWLGNAEACVAAFQESAGTNQLPRLLQLFAG